MDGQSAISPFLGRCPPPFLVTVVTVTMSRDDHSESGAVFGQNENKGGREDWREKLWLQHAEQQQSALVVEQSHGEEQCVFSPCARYS